MPVFYMEYNSDTEAAKGIDALKTNGIQSSDIYILTHADHRTERIAEMSQANTVGMAETGIGTAVANIFRNKGDELRSKLQELGFTEQESEVLEKKLDQEKVIVVAVNTPENFTL